MKISYYAKEIQCPRCKNIMELMEIEYCTSQSCETKYSYFCNNCLYQEFKNGKK